MDLFEAFQNRRSIRHFKPDPVSGRDIETILEAARLAPSWANTQCWRFIVVNNKYTKNRLANTLLKKNRGIEAIREAPVAIVACAEMGKSGIYEGQPVPDDVDWFMFDIGIAMEHIALAAYTLGLGTLIVGAFDSQKAKSILKVPDGYHVVSITPLGYPEKQPLPRPRKPISEIVFFDKFGNSDINK
jgi:nitroreductase